MPLPAEPVMPPGAPDKSAPGARLLLAGVPGVMLTGAEAPQALAARDAALLAWLALQGPTARTRLAALLWPDSDGIAARNSLRQRLYKLHRQLGVELVAGRNVLTLAAGVAHDLGDAADLFGGAPPAVGGEFAHWLEAERGARRRQRGAQLAARADGAAEAGDWAAALAHAEALLALDPHAEPAHRRLMRLHYLAGDRVAALLAYDRCERILKREVGTAPNDETLALLATIEKEQTPVHHARVVPPAVVVRPPRMIGRTRELAALRLAAASGLHAVVLGEGGMGKSRLLAEFAAGTAPLAQVGARPGDADRPYALLARLVRALCAQGHEPAAELRPELARFVAELGEPAPARFDADRFGHVVERWLRTLPAAAAVIDDLHFADGASVELLTQLAAAPGLPPLLLGLRPHEDAPAVAPLLQTLAELPLTERIDLAPLTVVELAELVDSLALPQLAGQDLAGPLRRHTGGNPQFVLETLRAMLVEGRAHVLGHGALPLPAGVGALIERRLTQLSPAALRLARVAAIAEVDFDATLATNVLGVDALDLADPWAELEAAQVLAGNGFAHDLVFEAVKRGVPQAVAGVLHAGVARALEAGGGSAASLARHWLAAGDAPRALGPLRVAAEQARATSRLREAAALYRQLAEIHQRRGEHPAHFEALLGCVQVLQESAADDELSAALSELEALAADDGQRARALSERAQRCAARFDLTGGEPAALQAIDLAQRAGLPAVASDARLVLVQLLLKRRRADDASAVLAAVRAWIEGDALPEQRVLYEECLAWLALEQGHYREAHRSWQRVADNAVERGLMAQLSTALNYQMLCLGYSGRFDEASAIGERQRALCQDHHLQGQSASWIEPNLAHTYTLGARFGAALAALERAGSAPGVHGSTLELRRAMLYLALGQPARALPFAQRAVEAAEGEVQRLLPLQGLLRVLHAQDPHAASSGPGTRRGERLCALLAECEHLAADADKSRPRACNRLLEAEIAGGPTRLAAADAALALLAGGETYALLITAHARRAQGLLECGRADEAQEPAQRVLALVEAYRPELMSLGEAMLCAAQALAAGGDARAPHALRQGADWLHKTAADHVPAEFRESFLQRIPAHRELLRLASSAAASASARTPREPVVGTAPRTLPPASPSA